MFLLQAVYGLCVAALLVYGINNLVMLILCLRRYGSQTRAQREVWQSKASFNWPDVVTQIPVYNEANSPGKDYGNGQIDHVTRHDKVSKFF